MSSELFIHRSLLPVLLWLALCAILAGLILEALDRLKQPRKPAPMAKSTDPEWVAFFQAMDNVIAALEQDETLEWRAQYSLVEEAELVAEQHQARLAKEQEG